MLQAIEVQNYRGLASLNLQGLGRVNLIVGKNNTGKTSLLEAIAVLSDPRTIDSLPGLFRSHPGQVEQRFYPWLFRDGSTTHSSFEAKSGSGDLARVLLRAGAAPPPGYGHNDWNRGVQVWSKWQRSLSVHAVSVQDRGEDRKQRPHESMIDAFAEAVRSPSDEATMVKLLACVDPRVTSVRLDAVGDKPFIVVDVGLTRRIPLEQAGQGLYRLVAIFSELFGRKPRIALVDEIENGIHHTALANVWSGVAEVAERLDIQFFATTHSRECLDAAHEAFSNRKEYGFRVVQLYRLDDGMSGRVLDRGHIQAAVAGDIELR